LGADDSSARLAISASTAANLAVEELDVAQAGRDRLRLLDRQLERRQPLAGLDAEQVRERRLALQTAHQDRVALVLGARARPHQLLAAREAAAQHPDLRIGRPDRIELAGTQQPRQPPRIEPVGLRPRLPDPRVVRRHRHHPPNVRLQNPPISYALPQTSSATRPSRPRLRANCSSCSGLVWIRPAERSTTSSTIATSQNSKRLQENQRANDSDRYVLEAQPGQIAGAAERERVGLEAHRPKRPARLRSPRKPPSRVTRT
jgi:hypothetical protein